MPLFHILYYFIFIYLSPKLCKSPFPTSGKQEEVLKVVSRMPNTECVHKDLLGQVYYLATFTHILARY